MRSWRDAPTGGSLERLHDKALGCAVGAFPLFLSVVVGGSAGFVITGMMEHAWFTTGLLLSFAVALIGASMASGLETSRDWRQSDAMTLPTWKVIVRFLFRGGIPLALAALALPALAVGIGVQGASGRPVAASMMASAILLLAALNECIDPKAPRLCATMAIAPWRLLFRIGPAGCALLIAALVATFVLGLRDGVPELTNGWLDAALAWHPAMVAPLLALNPFGTIGRMSESGALAGDAGNLVLAVLSLVLAALLAQLALRIRWYAKLTGDDPLRARVRRKYDEVADSRGMADEPQPPVVAPPWRECVHIPVEYPAPKARVTREVDLLGPSDAAESREPAAAPGDSTDAATVAQRGPRFVSESPWDPNLPTSIGDPADPLRGLPSRALQTPELAWPFAVALLILAIPARVILHSGSPLAAAAMVPAFVLPMVYYLWKGVSDGAPRLPNASALPILARDAQISLASRVWSAFAVALAVQVALSAHLPWWVFLVHWGTLASMERIGAWAVAMRRRAQAGRGAASAAAHALALLAPAAGFALAHHLVLRGYSNAPWHAATPFIAGYAAVPLLGIAFMAAARALRNAREDDTLLAPLVRATETGKRGEAMRKRGQ